MSDVGDMVAELISAGCLPVVAAQVVARAFVAGSQAAGIPVDSTAEKRRAYDRERKRRAAEFHRNSTGNPPDSENASLSKKDINNLSLERERERKGSFRGQRLRDDWQPSPQDQATGNELLGRQRMAAELEKFRDHWKQQPGSKGVKLDWDAAWRNWIRRAAEYQQGHTNGHSFNGSKQRRSAQSDFLAGIASVAADIAGVGPASGTADEEIPLGRFNIDG